MHTTGSDDIHARRFEVGPAVAAVGCVDLRAPSYPWMLCRSSDVTRTARTRSSPPAR